MKLNYKRTFFIGMAFMSITSFWQLYDNIIPLMLQNNFGLGETLTGGIMAVDNILALFLLPFFGSLSDRVDTRLGKRTPFILGGTTLAIIFMMIIPYSAKTTNFPLFFISLGLVLLSMGTYRSPAVALMPDLTPKVHRSSANAVINLMGAVGGITTLLFIRFLVPKGQLPDYTTVFIAVAVFMVVAVIVLLNTIKEKKLLNEIADSSDYKDDKKEEKQQEPTSDMPKDVKKSLYFILASIFLWFTAYNAITTAFSRYATRVWGMEGGSFAGALMVATGAAIVSYIPIGFISNKLGRKKTIIIGIITMSTSYFFGYFFLEPSSMINVVFAFTGFGWAAINVNSYPMVVEMSRSGDIGKYTGLYYSFSMAAQVFTPIFSGFLLENIGYRTLFPYAVVFSLLSLCTMLFVKHGDSRPPKKKSALDNFDVED